MLLLYLEHVAAASVGIPFAGRLPVLPTMRAMNASLSERVVDRHRDGIGIEGGWIGDWL